jgi:omega-6 fatty acid desaturase (delta-12 desaturase)
MIQWDLFLSLVTCIPYKYWARSHNHHHAHQGQLDTRTIGDVTLLTVKEYKNFLIGERLNTEFIVLFL